MEKYNSVDSMKKQEVKSEKRYDPIDKEAQLIKRQGLLEKAFDQFVRKDWTTIADHVLNDMIVPATLDWIGNTLKNIIDYVIYNGQPSQNRSGGYSKPSYSRFFNNPVSTNQSQPVAYQDFSPDWRDLTFKSYGAAQWAKDQLMNDIRQYGYAKVGDLIDMANNVWEDSRTGKKIPISPDPIDYKHGWADLSNARIVSLRGGLYRLDIPTPPIPLDSNN